MTKRNKIAVTIRLHPNEKKKLEDLAAAQNRTVTNWLETLIIEQWERLKQHEKTQAEK